MGPKFLLLIFFFFGVSFADDKTKSQNEYETGNALFVSRKYSDSLIHYHKAIELDPMNYRAIFRRATTYFTLGRTKPGLNDLDTVLTQKPDFAGARQQRANVLVKMGMLTEAAEDLQYLNSGSLSNEEIKQKLELIEHQKSELELLNQRLIGGSCADVERITTKLLEEQPWNPSLYMKRANCHQAEKELKAAIHDMKHAVKLSSDNTDLLHDISVLEYQVGDLRDSLSSIRECLKLNPDHKRCYSSYKSLRKTVKSLDLMRSSIEQQQWLNCIEIGEKLLKNAGDEDSVKINVYRLTCQCNREKGDVAKAIRECSQVLQFDDSDVETFILRAEAYMEDEEYDLATSDYEKVLEWDSSNNAAQTGKEQAKRAKELVGKRDYYKILGVRRNANKREITKAYRKMAQKWHPDNFQDEKEKKKAEKRFIDIASAKEVLSDEEKRRQFDNGQDPLDSEKRNSGHQGGSFHGFQGFNPFGRGGDQGGFSFHF